MDVETEGTMMHLTAPGTLLDHAQVVRYDGSFDLEILCADEFVRSAGDGSGACEVVGPKGTLRFDIGDWILRTEDGRLGRTDYDLSTLERSRSN
jgi:hypothetical protein